MKNTSLKLSQELKEAVFPQESYFKYCGGHTMYHDNEDGEFEPCENTDLLGQDEYCHTAGLTCEFLIAAPTAEEILDFLPKSILISRKGLKYWIEYKGKDKSVSIWGYSLAEAAGKMWLYLKKEELLGGDK